MASQGRGATVTVLFTDLVGSTELIQRAGDERAQRIFRAHRDLLANAVTHHGGHEVKWLGDGLMVAFPSAADAVSCAVEMQRDSARATAGERLRIRAGLNVGDALRDEADYFGTPVVIARRLCDRAEGGQILCSAVVPALLVGREFQFRDLGPMELKGIAAPVLACEVVYTRDSAGGLRARTPFVGRNAETARLLARLKDARAGIGGLVTLSGEPGIGKTRLAEEFCDAARIDGAAVLWGRCYEGEWSPPYGPFIEAIEAHAREAEVDTLRHDLGPNAGLVAKLATGISDRVSDLPDPPELQPEDERFRLLEAVSQFFVAVSARVPLVLVLDDLHWAGSATVAMLRHLARAAASSPILILGTYRDVELGRRHPLADALGALPRETNHTRIPLKGLASQEIGELLETMAEQEVPLPLVESISAETDGNPFFIREVILHLTEEGKIFHAEGRWTSKLTVAEMGIPESVRQVIGRRLSRLSENANLALSHASVLGRNFDFDVLLAFTEMDDNALLGAADEALDAQLIEEARAQFGASYRFAHALVQGTLYDELSVARKQRLHLRAGQALEKARSGRLEPLATDLARHFREGNDLEKAIGYSVQAGEQARLLAAYEEAVTHWEAARELMEEQGAEPTRRAAHLERLGGLLYTTSIDQRKGAEYLEGALRLYKELGQEERAAQIHSRLGSYYTTWAGAEVEDVPRALEHFQAAEAVLARGPERASLGYLYVGLSNAQIRRRHIGEALVASQRALEIADRLHNQALWASAANQQGWALAESGHVARSLSLLEKAWEVAERLERQPLVLMLVCITRATVANQLLDPLDAAACLSRALAAPGVSRSSREVLLRTIAFNYDIAGRLKEARRLLDEASSLEVLPWAAGSIPAWGSDAWEVLAKRITSQDDQCLRAGDFWPFVGNSAAAAQLHRALGRPHLAEGRLVAGLAHCEDGGGVLFEIRTRAELASFLADSGRVAEAQVHLTKCLGLMSAEEDWRGLSGRVAFAAGAVAAAEGRLDEAERHFLRSIDGFQRFSLPWEEVEALRHWGRALLRSGMRDAAHEKLNAAIDVYRRHGAGERWVELVEREKLSA